MKTANFGFRYTVGAILLSAAAAQAQPSTPPMPIPRALREAKTIFISNAGADSGLFPEPFSGEPSRAYRQFYEALKAAGTFQIVDDPVEADLVLELQLTAPSGPNHADKQNGTSDPLPMFRLVIFQQKTHYVLWALTQSIDAAIKQKTHDRNFDDALNTLVSQLQALAGKQHTANS